MTNSEIIKKGIEALKSVSEDAGFDAMCIFENVFGISKTQYLLKKDSIADERKTELFFEMTERRKNGEPLQYILGQWEFFGLKFNVGEGVLIPRADTEILVEYVLAHNEKDNPIIYDLCSGSGCIAISIAQNLPDATVYAVEKSEDAYKYLLENINLNNVKNIKPILGSVPEILEGLESADIIVSNPPYIKSDEIPTLQKEVLREPLMALDGGEDGLDFYRILHDYAVLKLKSEGFIIVECGDTQAKEVAEIFKTNIILKDYNAIDRAVVSRKG